MHGRLGTPSEGALQCHPSANSTSHSLCLHYSIIALTPHQLEHIFDEPPRPRLGRIVQHLLNAPRLAQQREGEEDEPAQRERVCVLECCRGRTVHSDREAKQNNWKEPGRYSRVAALVRLGHNRVDASTQHPAPT